MYLLEPGRFESHLHIQKREAAVARITAAALARAAVALELVYRVQVYSV